MRELARRLRTSFADAYPALADRVEAELGLRNAKLPAGASRLDRHIPFRGARAAASLRRSHRERASSTRRSRSSRSASTASGLIATSDGRPSGKPAVAWPSWAASAMAVRAAVSKAGGDANAWIDAYTSKDGWFRLDQAQRRLEAWVANLDDEPRGAPTRSRSGAYEDACHAMADGFTKALVKAELDRLGVPAPDAHLQRGRRRASRSRRVLPRRCHALRDGRRARRAAAQRPPRSSSGPPSARCRASRRSAWRRFSRGRRRASASSSRAASSVRGSTTRFFPTSRARKKFAAARVPKLVDISLDELLSLQPSKLAKKIDGAQVVVVRSQEIDHAGETGFTFQARQVMDTVIDNLARAIRKLAAAGVEHAVVTADHGHLFFAIGSRRVDADRRAGRRRGRSAPPLLDRTRRSDSAGLRPGDRRRRSATTPTSISCFPLGMRRLQGGRRSRLPPRRAIAAGAGHTGAHGPHEGARDRRARPLGPSTATGLPDAVTNRIFSVTLQLDGKNLSLFSTELVVRPLLMSAGKQVGGGRDGRRRRFRSRDRLREASSPASPSRSRSC